METPLSPLALCHRGFELYPDAPCVLGDGPPRSYRDVRARVERLAGALGELGVARGDHVALLAPNTASAFECYLAVPLAGAVLVPLNVRLSPEDLAWILDHVGARTLLFDPAVSDLAQAALASLSGVRAVRLGDSPGGRDGEPAAPPFGDASLEEAARAAEPLPFDPEVADERDVLSINYTSGTTARPKGVMQTHRNNFLNAVDMILALGLGRDDAHLHVAPLFHANGWGMIWATLAVGAANVMLPRVTPGEVAWRMRAHGVTTLAAAATVLVRLLEEPADLPKGPGVRVAVAGMAPPAEILRRVEVELGWEVRHLYGLTETTAFITYCEPSPELRTARDPAERAERLARQGVPLPLAGRVRVVRGDMQDVLPDGRELGEVVARGNVIMRGYFRDPEATAEAFRGGWFHTGDLAVRHPDGSIEIKDRRKDVIVSGGENISSLEVEAAICRHPAVAQAAVVAGPHPVWGETPVAFVVPRRGASLDPRALVEHARRHLAHFKVPTRVVVVPDLPRTASGKVRKDLLRAELRRENEGGVGPPA